MLDKKAGIPIDEFRGALTATFVAAIVLLFLIGSSVASTKKTYKEAEISTADLEAIKALYLFLESPADEYKTASDLIIELYTTRNNKLLTEELNKLTQEYFSKTVTKGIILLNDGTGYNFYDSKYITQEPNTKVIAVSKAKLPILSESGEDIEFITVIFQLTRDKNV